MHLFRVCFIFSLLTGSNLHMPLLADPSGVPARSGVRVPSGVYDEEEGPRDKFTAEQIRLFEDQIVGLLKTNCLKCHAGTEPKGGLNLTQRATILAGGESGPAVDTDNPGDSILLMAVNYDGYQMPPTGQLSPQQIEALTNWVRMGLPWPQDLHEIEFEVEPGPPVVDDEARRFWSFQQVQKPQVPAAASDWVRNEIDAYVAAGHQSAGLTPAAAASPRQLIRRAYYDLIGLPPTLDDVERFAANPTQEEWHRVIDRLLDSPHYGEQWGRHWLDLVRYAETNSYERDGAKPHVWRYRDYVIRSFNEDKPYDRFITEQLAGDELPDRSAETIVATGFYRLGRWDDEPADPELAFYDDLDDILTTTGQTMLGLTINCARCHDHKIDPMPQTDYYRMLAFFQQVRRYGVRSHESVLEASVMPIDEPEHNEILNTTFARYEQELNSIERSLESIEAKVLPDLDGVERDEFQYEVNRVRIVEKRLGGLQQKREVDRYRSQTARRNHLREHRPSGMGQALCVKEDTSHIRSSHVLLRGNPHVQGDPVTPGFPSVLSPPEVTMPPIADGATSTGRRLILAQWIASPQNPLTARVMVNRIWQYHFGRGIVRTSSDFGYQGIRPTHPELLDWLAATFTEQNWSIKSMHRLIMRSATYQLSSAAEGQSLARDATNDYFWRFDMRRLKAEEIRDSILRVTGTLSQDRMFGPSIYTRIPAEVKAGQSQPGSGWGQSSPEDEARRSIYIHVKRSLLDPILEGFDFADTDQTCPLRFSTTQPTQALGMLNSDFILEQSEIFARRMSHQFADQPPAAAAVTGSNRTAADDTPDNLASKNLTKNEEGSAAFQVRWALQQVLQREPEQIEVGRGIRLLHSLQQDYQMTPQDARKYFCLVALNLNEFIYLD